MPSPLPLPVLEMLEPRWLLSSGTLGSLVDSAASLDLAPIATTQIHATLGEPGQVDSFRFTAQATGHVVIDMNALGGGGLDSFLQVYRISDGRLVRVAANNNAVRGTLDSQLRLRTVAGTEYMVLAGGYRDQTAGDYALTLTGAPRDDHGRTFDTARLARLNKWGEARLGGTINYTGDLDMFQFVATETGLMQMEIEGHGRASLSGGILTAFDAAGVELALSSDDGLGSSQLTFHVTAGETYYIGAAGSGDNTGTYRIQLSTLSSLALNAESVGLSATGLAAFQASIAASGQADSYRFTAQADGHVQINMNAAGGDLDSFLEVFQLRNGRLVRVASNNNANSTLDSQIKLRVRAGQEYFVVASGYRHASTGDYALTLAAMPKDDYGNTFDDARALRMNGSGSGKISGRIDYSGDVDMFTFTATQTGVATVQLQARDSTLNGTQVAYDAAGGELASDSDSSGSGYSLAVFDVIAGETYYLSAGGSDGSTGRFTLSISTEPAPPPPAPEPEPTPDPDPTPQPDPESDGDPMPDVSPGQSVAAWVVSQSSGLQLVVAGTDQADTIVLSQTAGMISMFASGVTQSFQGLFSSLIVYGFAGDDLIRLDHTVTATAWVYGGDGNDSLYAAGPGAAHLFGQAGDDLLVSIGGGTATLSGGAGFDSFWYDPADTVADASSAETAGKNLHRVAEFYQPYSPDPANSQYVPLQIAGQNFTDPAAGYQYRNFAHVPLFVNGPGYSDVAQGVVGDCYFLASLASFAYTDANVIRQAIVDLGDGTFAVRFFRNSQEHYVRIDADLPTNSGGSLVYARLGADGELWVPLMEKAYAHFRYGQNSYASLNGGWMSTVNYELTNAGSATRWSGGTDAQMFDFLGGHLNGGRAVTAGTYSSLSGAPVAASHAYMVKSVHTDAGQMYVTVYNPWGYDGSYTDSNPSDGLITLTIGQFQQYFTASIASLA